MFDDATKRNGDVQVFFPDTKLPGKSTRSFQALDWNIIRFLIIKR